MKVDISIPEMTGLAEWNQREAQQLVSLAEAELSAAKWGNSPSSAGGQKSRVQNALAYLRRAEVMFKRAFLLGNHAHNAANVDGPPPDYSEPGDIDVAPDSDDLAQSRGSDGKE